VVSDGGEHWLADPEFASGFLYHALAPSSMAAEVAYRYGAHGPATVVSTGCTSGIDAVGHGVQLIEDGVADVAVSGAADAPITPISIACFDAIRATSARDDDPEHASRPFDATRDGFVMGEGSDYVPGTARDHRVDVALSMGSGFGGFQSAIVLARPGVTG